MTPPRRGFRCPIRSQHFFSLYLPYPSLQRRGTEGRMSAFSSPHPPYEPVFAFDNCKRIFHSLSRTG